MRTVLGIDAAWTLHNRSGVALVEEIAGGWRLTAVAASYGRFHGLASGPQIKAEEPKEAWPDPVALIETCRRLTGRSPDLVAVDMPLSLKPICGRRVSDRQLSKAYGAKKCATHSPSAVRPGKISDNLREAFEGCGYCLRTAPGPPETTMETPGLIEVYPHPALVELMNAPERLKYKAGKIANYWDELKPAQRREKLFGVWNSIVAALEIEIAEVVNKLPRPKEDDRSAALKSFEDALDAVICAWGAIQALRGRATAYGDDNSAIWIPWRN
jgi:predicted RNase H-like nuclease